MRYNNTYSAVPHTYSSSKSTTTVRAECAIISGIIPTCKQKNASSAGRLVALVIPTFVTVASPCSEAGILRQQHALASDKDTHLVVVLTHRKRSTYKLAESSAGWTSGKTTSTSAGSGALGLPFTVTSTVVEEPPSGSSSDELSPVVESSLEVLACSVGDFGDVGERFSSVLSGSPSVEDDTAAFSFLAVDFDFSLSERPSERWPVTVNVCSHGFWVSPFLRPLCLR